MRGDVGRIDFGAYLRAFGLLARNPWLAVPTLAASLAVVAVGAIFPRGIGLGLDALIDTLIIWFGMAVAVILADAVWRRGTGSLATAWSDARRRAADILWAILGLTFVQWVVSYLVQTLSFLPAGVAFALNIVVTFFFVYTVPAAAIGGVPGSAALQVSIERVQLNRLNATAVTALVVFAPWIANTLVIPFTPLFAGAPLGYVLLAALIRAVVDGYAALMLARGYSDVSFGRFR